MSEFQPINKTKNMPKPAVASKHSEPPVSATTDRESLLALQACASNSMQCSSQTAQPCTTKKSTSPMAFVPAKKLQASMSSETSHEPQKLPQKKRKNKNDAPRAIRKQAVRAVKVVPTIEHSETRSFTEDTPTPSTRAESDSNWSIASTHLGELDSGMSPPTPHGRDPRHPQSSICARTRQRMTLSSSTRLHKTSSHESSGNAVKGEDTASLERSLIRPRSLSPSDYNREIREKKFQDEEVVELPPAEWAYQRYVQIKQQNKKEQRAMKKLWKELRRKQKCKQPVRGLEGDEETSSPTPSKRKPTTDLKTNKTVKRQKKSHKRSNAEPLAGPQPIQNAATRSAHPLMAPCRERNGQSALPGKQQNLMMNLDSLSEAIVSPTTNDVFSGEAKQGTAKGNETMSIQPKASDTEKPKRNTSKVSIPTGPRASQSRPNQISRSWQPAGGMREVELQVPRPSICQCKRLPNYFKQPYLLEPSLADFGRGEAEFLLHVRQVSACEEHNQRLIDTCRFILVQEQKNEWRKAESSSAPNAIGDATSFAEDWLSSSRYARSSRDMCPLYDRNRQQHSSIDPKDFYGKKPEYRVPPNFQSSPPIPDKVFTTENKHRDAERLKRALEMTPPDSSPASKDSTTRGKSTGAHVPLDFHVNDDCQPLADDDDPVFPTPRSSPTTQSTQRIRSAESSDYQSCDTSPSQSKCVDRNTRTKSGSPNNGKDQPSPYVDKNKVNQITKEVPGSPNGRPLRPRSLGAQRKRHQSVPVNLLNRKPTLDERDAQRRDNPLQEISSNAILLKMDRTLASMRKEVLERLPATPRIESVTILPETAPSAAAVDGNHGVRAQRRRRKGASASERRRRYPRLDKNVPEHLRLPPEEIIKLGRIKKAYERHLKAPYAFSDTGRLYAPYKELLVRLDSNGSTVWDANEISRLRH